MLTPEIIEHFNVPGPRYTSYPTAPEWKDVVSEEAYLDRLDVLRKPGVTTSVYVHIPFCTSMCYYCGCNVTIRKNTAEVGDTYIEYLAKELALVMHRFSHKPSVKQFHFGGGTPNFLSPDQLSRVFALFQRYFDIDLSGEVAIEVDPRVTTLAHLDTLKALGFNRLSMGIQDFDPIVQKAVNRIQSLESVTTLIQAIRDRGFSSLNLDLIYGLPFQTQEGFSRTIEHVIGLRPDRIALYSYAHVPWLKEHQSLIQEKDLPSADAKIQLFLSAREALIQGGYLAIAMDHFALESDEMAQAYLTGTLYRNFMGYTVKPAQEYIGFGVSAIGFCNRLFVQNVKSLKDYYAALDGNLLPLDRGKFLSDDDHRRQWVITQLMCHFRLSKSEFFALFSIPFDTHFSEEHPHISNCIQEGLLTIQNDSLCVTDLGKLFVRNICMGFDAYLSKGHQRFSKTV